LRVLVTGASGFIGANIVRALLTAGHDVRALVRTPHVPPSLAGLAIDTARGDIRDAASIETALAGCDALIHAAALYEITGFPEREFIDTNVAGTRNVLEAARNAGIGRIVYTSSVATVGYLSHRQPADECSFARPEDAPSPYHRSKIYAERLVLAAAREGAPVVVLNPSAPVGAWDTKPTPLGRMIVDFCAGRMPGYVATGLNVVDVEAVAAAHVAALTRGEIGERYIIGGANLPLIELLRLIGDAAGRRPPRLRVPWLAAYLVALADEGLVRRVRGGRARVPIAGVRHARHWAYYDSSKAKAALGLGQADPAPAVARAVEWFRANGYF
jgi:dihydroflavonol-4-reductase